MLTLQEDLWSLETSWLTQTGQMRRSQILSHCNRSVCSLWCILMSMTLTSRTHSSGFTGPNQCNLLNQKWLATSQQHLCPYVSMHVRIYVSLSFYLYSWMFYTAIIFFLLFSLLIFLLEFCNLIVCPPQFKPCIMVFVQALHTYDSIF